MIENYETEIKTMQNKVFMKTLLAICISAIFSFIPTLLPLGIFKVFTDYGWASFLLTLGVLIFSMTRLANSESIAVKRGFFYFISAFFGLITSTIYIVYDLGTIGIVFLITSIYFLLLYVFSKTTKIDFTQYTGVLSVALLTLIIAMFINLIFPIGIVGLMISVVAIGIFSFYTVHDFQKIIQYIKENNGYDEDEYDSISYVFAMNLYLDFLNLFLHLLDIFGR